LRPFNFNLTVIDIKNFPLLGLIMESLGEKQAKRCLTEFSGVWAYTPIIPAVRKGRPQGGGGEEGVRNDGREESRPAGPGGGCRRSDVSPQPLDTPHIFPILERRLIN